MNARRAIQAVWIGFRLCFFCKDIRKLAIRPWIVGGIVYLLTWVGAYHAHAPLLNWLIESPVGFWAHALFYLAWLGVALFLVVSTLLVSFVMVLVFTGAFQTSIALAVLKKHGASIPIEQEGVGATIKEISRSAAVESIKLVWLLPLGLIFLIVGFIPILSPFALIGGAWILAFESTDIVLDIYKGKIFKRTGYALKNWFTLVVYGLGLTAIGLVPLFGLFLPPLATAGAAWLLSQPIKDGEIPTPIELISH